ncbi:hypothetical protein [Kitasatospora sp. NPDC085879]|uniref:hypothetical protein n=1 Tax=Kitasatospora sp. NPDC085879 TaxID=3154769 RepID=UPI00341FC1B3
MLLTVPLEVPAGVLRVSALRARLLEMPADALVVAERATDDGSGWAVVGWPVQAHVRDESGRRVCVVGLPQVNTVEDAMSASMLWGRLVGLPDDALVVTVWETEDGPRQTTLGWPVEDLTMDESGNPAAVVTLPPLASGATGYAYDEFVYTLGWE